MTIVLVPAPPPPLSPLPADVSELGVSLLLRQIPVLDAKEQIEARDMYWEDVSSDTSKEGYLERAEERLLGCIEKNPFVGEPHVLLSQVYLGKKRFKDAERETQREGFF